MLYRNITYDTTAQLVKARRRLRGVPPNHMYIQYLVDVGVKPNGGAVLHEVSPGVDVEVERVVH